MIGLTSYSKTLMRISIMIGGLCSIGSFLVALVYFVIKLIYWDKFSIGIGPVLTGLFFLMGVLFIYLGIMGEYILTITTRVVGRPLVVEEERINFDE